MAEGNPTTSQIVRGELDHNAVARKHTDIVLSHAATKMSEHLVAILQFDLELRVGQRLKHGALNSDRIRILPSWSRLSGCGCRLNTAASAFLLL